MVNDESSKTNKNQDQSYVIADMPRIHSDAVPIWIDSVSVYSVAETNNVTITMESVVMRDGQLTVVEGDRYATPVAHIKRLAGLFARIAETAEKAQMERSQGST